MSKLTDTQLVILSAASQRPDRRILPLPDRLKGGAAQKVVGALIARDLAAEVAARPGDPVWRESDGQGLTLVATDAALAALGVEPDSAPDAAEEAQAAPAAPETAEAPDAAPDARTPPDAAKAPKTRAGTKQAQLIAMLERPEGATIAEIVAALDWKAHTARGAIAGALKKKLGLNVVSEKDAARGRIYKICA